MSPNRATVSDSLLAPEGLRVAGLRDRHRAAAVMTRGFSLDAWSNVASMSSAIFAAAILNIAGSWPANIILGLVAGPLIWIGSTYAGSLPIRGAWMLRTPQGAAVLRLNGSTILSFAAWPRGLGIGDQLLDHLTTEADRSRHVVCLRCPRGEVAFYQRHGFVVIGDEHRRSPQLVRMRRPATQR